MPRILVLEDEPEVNALLRDVLTVEGYDVVCLSHPSQVASALLITNPDLFLIDLMLPGSNGTEVARDLRMSRFAGVPIIAVSASVLQCHMAERCGVFDETIRKPFDVDELIDSIKRCLAAPVSALGQATDDAADGRRQWMPRVMLGDAG
ncbi:MAG TPA: response regulator [Chloroflexota bacterium]|nr:response regulator [Chloroflexota bacterium]